MTRRQHAKPHRIFISYAHEDQARARRFQVSLQRDGFRVFVDYAKVEIGNSLPSEINAGLRWCDTLLLLWSRHAAESYYVTAEWEAAFNLRRRIIPIVLHHTELPPLLSRSLYLTFSDYKTAYRKLRNALGLPRQTSKMFI